MRNKIIDWIIALLILIRERDNNIDNKDINKLLKDHLFLYYSQYEKENFRQADIEISKISFNAKYKDTIRELHIKENPNELLTSFYRLANKGDNSFISHPFFRILHKLKDKEALNLKYRLSLKQ